MGFILLLVICWLIKVALIAFSLLLISALTIWCVFLIYTTYLKFMRVRKHQLPIKDWHSSGNLQKDIEIFGSIYTDRKTIYYNGDQDLDEDLIENLEELESGRYSTMVEILSICHMKGHIMKFEELNK